MNYLPSPVLFPTATSLSRASIFTVTILRSVYPGRSTVQMQLLAVPSPFVGLAFALTMAYVAMKTGRHAFCIMGCLILAIIGYSLWIVVSPKTDPNEKKR